MGSGSACACGTLEPSRVLAAIGALTHGNVRVALHPGVTSEDVDRFLAVLPEALDTRASRLGAPRIARDGRSRTAAPIVVDARGKACPCPIIMLAKAASDLAPGTELTVLATDVAARYDVPAWARMTGQRLCGESETDGGALALTVRLRMLNASAFS